MELIAYILHPNMYKLRPANYERAWMDATTERYAYRCLPLTIANCYGWEILSPCNLSVTWNGGDDKSDLSIQYDIECGSDVAVSHFGHGILTFKIPFLFRTDKELELYLTAPINNPKDAIQALTGVIETGWAHQSFTMNWKFTRPTTIRFSKDEPICHFFPIMRTVIETVTPKLRDIGSDQSLLTAHSNWSAARLNFLEDLKQPDSYASKKKWEKHYHRGITSTNERFSEHRSKLRLMNFVKDI